MVMPMLAPRLLVVADRAYAGDDDRWLAALRAVGEAARGEPVWVQVRAKTYLGDALADLAVRAREAIPADVPALLNGDASSADLAAALGYDGLHWPEDAIPAAAPLDGLRVHSAAIHSEAALHRAEEARANFAVFGAVHAPGSKPGDGVGVEALRAITEASTVPVIAIGGISPARVAACIQAGAYGVAVVSGVLGAPSPAEAIHAYLAALAAAVNSTSPMQPTSPAQRGNPR